MTWSLKSVHLLLYPALAAVLLAGSPVRAGGAEETVWRTDHELALEEALITRRPVLVTFYADWCNWCRKLERTTFRDLRFRDLAGDLIPVRVNGEKTKGLTALLRVRDYPTTLVLSRQGRVLKRIVGYKPPAEFVGLVAEGLAGREPAEEARAATVERPEDPEAWYVLGDVLLARGEYGEAGGALTRAGDLSEEGKGEIVSDARLDAALARLLAGDAAGAVPGFKDFLERYPESGRRDQGRYLHGLALMGAGRGEEGLEEIEAAAASTSSRFIRREAERLRARSREEGQEGG